MVTVSRCPTPTATPVMSVISDFITHRHTITTASVTLLPSTGIQRRNFSSSHKASLCTATVSEGLPDWAANCNDMSAFSSACTCLGARYTTTTTTAQRVTVMAAV